MTSDKRVTPGTRVAQKVVDKVNAKTEKLDRVAQKVNAKADKLDRVAQRVNAKADRLDRIAEKAAKKADTLDRITTGLGAFDLWTRTEPNARRPRFTRDELTGAAVHIADTEGFDALSMRRLAHELGAGTMTLYHYVKTKDELLTLVVDAIMSEVVLGPDESMPASWRDAMTLIAGKSRASLLRHPWILDLTEDPGFGPNSVRHFDQSLQAVASLPIPMRDRFDIVSAVDEYVFGSCIAERHHAEGYEGADTRTTLYVNALVATGDYPQLAALTEQFGYQGAWDEMEKHRFDPSRFDRNLRRLLDGIEADLPNLIAAARED
jgi:AcrR family transcriptional regulator